MRAGIIGGGVIGAGWARLLRRNSIGVRVWDRDLDRCQGAASLEEAVAGADLVIEAVAEREAEKRAVLVRAGEAAPAAVIASASSSILPSRLQEGVPRPERVLVLHPLHPVELLPVVEVVPGGRTSPATVGWCVGLLEALGKAPVVLRREVPGYLVNRLAAALWREAMHLVLEGVADAAAVDLAASRGPCLGWAVQGPFLTYELGAPGGLGAFMAHLHPAFQAIWRDLARWESVPPGGAERLVAAVEQAYGGQDRRGLEEWRDRTLLRVVQALTAEVSGGGGPGATRPDREGDGAG